MLRRTACAFHCSCILSRIRVREGARLQEIEDGLQGVKMLPGGRSIEDAAGWPLYFDGCHGEKDDTRSAASALHALALVLAPVSA
jgi:hypothetical protein